ncbi:MAG TPA: hypothetical protein VL742_14365 [Casimicrobiaceae bacterium]|nr:hypothetical protein [Casimicrobiaceae bacterium]
MALGFVNTTFSYDPSTDGPTTSIAVAVDKDLSANLIALPGSPFGNGFRPLVEQGGNDYLALISGPMWTGGDTGFLTLSAPALLASSVQEFDFSMGSFTPANHPDFSGGPMLFGIGQLFAEGGFPERAVHRLVRQPEHPALRTGTRRACGW